jgi:predicted amidohydrolase
MMTTNRKFKVACVQATPVIFDLEKSVEKVITLSATVDLDEVVCSRLDFDVTGHYSRNDIFELKVKDQPGIK